MTDTSPPTMEAQTEKQKVSNGQLIFVPHEDTIRLMEVYVKRSLSVNDGRLPSRRDERREKWVTKKARRHSSDPSLHLADGSIGIGDFQAVELSSDRPEACPEEPEKPEKQNKKSKKNKKPSFWKSLLGFFSRRGSEDKDEEQDSATETPRASTVELPSEAAISCLPTAPVSSPKKSSRRKSIKRRFSKRRLSLLQSKLSRDRSPAGISDFEAVTRVEATYSYYEKVSEELEKIVLEVKVKEEDQRLSDEEVINRIIELTKEEGDAIDTKLKDNPTLSNFFQGMSYANFQRLADIYLEKEATPTHSPVTVPPTAPELVKLAFTLDFTARVAGLSQQNIGHITGLGNRYLQDRFEYSQKGTDHPWSDSDD